MHRSGTSLLVGLLELHGFHLGNVSTQKSTLKPTGTKENLEIRKINNQLFSAKGTDWKCPEVPKILNETMTLHVNQTADKFKKFSQWAIKDPRMLFTYKIWEKYLPEHKIIGTYRKPIEVAHSLQVKNDIPISEGLEIWRRYNLRLLELWQEKPFPVIEFTADKQIYLTQFKQVVDHLGVKFKRQESSDFYQHKGSQFNENEEVPAVYLNLAKQLEELTQSP